MSRLCPPGHRAAWGSHGAVGVTAQDYGNLKFYVQHAAAAYCNMDRKAGDLIKCENNCPGVEGDKATIVSTFV